MKQADEATRELGLSRSELILTALRDFLRQRHWARICEQLDQTYANTPSDNERRLVQRLRTKLPVQDRW